MPVFDLSPYRKTLTALVGAVVSWATLVLTSAPDGITGPEWLAGGIGLATALGVYGATNTGTPANVTAHVNAAVSSVYREVDTSQFPPLPEPVEIAPDAPEG